MKAYKHKHLPLTDKLEACFRFACWCRDNRVQPYHAAQLHAMAKRAYNGAVREANGGRQATRQRREFDAFAATLGFGVVWDGLMPTLTWKNGSKVQMCPNL